MSLDVFKVFADSCQPITSSRSGILAFILCAPKLLLDMDWVPVPRGDDETGLGPAILSLDEREDRGPLHGMPFITAFTRYQ